MQQAEAVGLPTSMHLFEYTARSAPHQRPSPAAVLALALGYLACLHRCSPRICTLPPCPAPAPLASSNHPPALPRCSPCPPCVPPRRYKKHAGLDCYPPLQIMMASKTTNRGKLDSHCWFFDGFAYLLQPDYCVLFDAGGWAAGW